MARPVKALADMQALSMAQEPLIRIVSPDLLKRHVKWQFLGKNKSLEEVSSPGGRTLPVSLWSASSTRTWGSQQDLPGFEYSLTYPHRLQPLLSPCLGSTLFLRPLMSHPQPIVRSFTSVKICIWDMSARSASSSIYISQYQGSSRPRRLVADVHNSQRSSATRCTALTALNLDSFSMTLCLIINIPCKPASIILMTAIDQLKYLSFSGMVTQSLKFL